MATSGVYQVSVRPGWIEQIVLYVMIIADSGSGKSRLINMVKKPMNAVMDEKRARHDQTAGRQAFIAKEQMKSINKMRQGERNKLIKEMLGKDGRCDYNKLIQLTAEEAVEAHNAIEQVELARPDSRPSLFLSDGTSKGIQAALIQNHEYQAICEPEGGLPLKMVHDKGFDLDLLLKSYDGEEHQYVTSDGTACLKRPRLNILYGIQPGVAAKFFGCDRLNERGLTARFLPIFPGFQARQNIEEAVLHEDDHIIQHILTTCHDLKRDGVVRVMRLDEDAEYMVAEFERELEHWIADGFEHISPFINKLRGTACRLAAALHLWLNYQNPEKTPISAQTMACGIELARSLMPHVDYAYNQHGLQAHSTAIRLLEWIEKLPKNHFELRAALQDTGLKKSQALPALDVLEMHDIIRQIVTTNNSRICVVNSNLYSQQLNIVVTPQPAYGPSPHLASNSQPQNNPLSQPRMTVTDAMEWLASTLK